MRNPDPDLIVHLLAGSVSLHTSRVVPKLIALAQIEVAPLGIEPFETAGVGPEESFGIAGAVGLVEVNHGLATSGGGDITGLAGGR